MNPGISTTSTGAVFLPLWAAAFIYDVAAVKKIHGVPPPRFNLVFQVSALFHHEWSRFHHEWPRFNIVLTCFKPTSFLESPHLALISFCRRNQHFYKPCLTPHVVFIIVNKCSCSCVSIQYGSLKDQMCWCHSGFPLKKNNVGFEYHHTNVKNNSRYNKSLLHLEVEIVGVQTTVSPTLYCINPHGQYQHDSNPIQIRSSALSWQGTDKAVATMSSGFLYRQRGVAELQKISWESKGNPPMPPPPRNKALIRPY